MNRELWRWVAGYEGLYIVSNMGNVMGVPKPTQSGHLLKQKERSGSRGYMSVCLCKDNKKKYFSVHRLVATAFIPNPKNKPEVNHKNGNRADNRVENLEWVTSSENEKHSYGTLGKRPTNCKLTDAQVVSIRNDDRSCREICLEYGVSKSTIVEVKNGKRYAGVV